MTRKSKRFNPSTWTEVLVPAFLIVLVLGLIATLVIIGMSMLGLTPAF